MIRIVFLFVLFSFYPKVLLSQNWKPLGNGLETPNSVRAMYCDTFDNLLYVAGQIGFLDGKKIKGITKWNGLYWDSLESGIDGLDTLNNYPTGPTLAITRYNNELFVGGTFNSVGNIYAPKIAKWNGNQWDSIPINPFNLNPNVAVEALAVINNELYVGGYFDSIAGMQCSKSAKWDGTNWHCLSIPPSINMYGAYIFSICEYNGEIYIGGNFSNNIPNDSLDDILKFDGNTWKSVGSGLKGFNSFVSSMKVYKGLLYVAGRFSQAEGNKGNNIQTWNGNSWSDIGGVTNINNCQISDLLIHDSKLFVLGQFQNAGSIPAINVATWDGSVWCGFGDTYNNDIGKGAILKDTLIIGGGFSMINSDSINYIAKWAGGNFIDTCSSTIGISQIIENDEIIYPNPTFGSISILSSSINATITLYDYSGQFIRTFIYSPNKQSQYDISELNKGIYFMKISDNLKSNVFKIIKL